MLQLSRAKPGNPAGNNDNAVSPPHSACRDWPVVLNIDGAGAPASR